MSKQRKTKIANQKRQPGSLKVWQHEENGFVWESVSIHRGRTTELVRGPLGKHLNIAHDFLNAVLKGETPE